ncbi:MAG: AAA family ATPase [Candidatus Korobacteraceae bacterium]
MFTVTFYSYKGGVGRTMGLMNTAVRLGKKGKRVFIIDFDLEAPGIDAFLNPEDRNREGLLEYVSGYAGSGAVPDIRNYVVELPGVSPDCPPIQILPAGKKDLQYQSLLANLNWKQFYADQRGFLFVENLKGAIESIYAPDYLLVDSRTGLTDISGICTVQLPDLVVMLFALNNQNLEGTGRILRAVRQNKMSREIKTLLVASPVPDTAAFSAIREKRIGFAEEILAEKVAVMLPLDPSVAFYEFILSQKTALASGYDQLTDSVIKRNQYDVANLLSEARRLRIAGNPEEAKLALESIVQSFPGNSEAHRQYGVFLRSVNDFRAALDEFQAAFSLSPKPTNLRELARTYLLTGKSEEASTWFRRYVDSSKSANAIIALSREFDRANQIDPAISGFLKALSMLKDTDLGSRVDVLGKLTVLHITKRDMVGALTYGREWVALTPNLLHANYNYAYALMLAGRPTDAKEYFTKSLEVVA